VKTARDPKRRRDLSREAVVYEFLRRRCPATSSCLPNDIRWDPETGELGMEAVSADDLTSAVADEGWLAADVGRELGRTVAVLHKEARGLGDEAPPSAWSTGGIDWHRPGLARFRQLSRGGWELLRMLQRSERLQAHLARIGDPRRGDTVIHGDLRLANVLLATEASSPRIWLVDWEFAGFGESAWDVASLMAAGLGEWLSTIPQVPGVAPHRLLDEASLRLDHIRPGLASFWTAYMNEARPDDVDAWTRRCIELVAAGLVHLGFEATARDERVRASAVAHLQVALNILEQPERSTAELLGISG
jgi:aminoglycoside phosphotransferase (APT) family kinase protein